MGEAMTTLNLAWQKLEYPNLHHPISWAEHEGTFYVASGQSPWFCLQDCTLAAAIERARKVLLSHYKFMVKELTEAAPPDAARSTEEGE